MLRSSWPLAALLCLAPAAVGEDPAYAPGIELPRATRGVDKRRIEPRLRLVVNLTRDGKLSINPRDVTREAREESVPIHRGLKEVTLARLGAELSAMRMDFHHARQEAGDSGFERDGRSRLIVVLRADARARWAHCAWITRVLVDTRFGHVALAVRGGRLPFRLARIRTGRGTPYERALIGAQLVVDLAAGAGDTPARFRFGERETDNAGELAKWVAAQAKREQKRERDWIRTLVRIPDGAAVADVAALLSALRGKKLKEIYLDDATRSLPRGVRSATPLPAPETNAPLEPCPAVTELHGPPELIVKG